MRVSHAYPLLLGELLTATAARLPDKEALVFQTQRVSWREYDRRVENLAKAFLRLGIEPGDRIGVISTTRPEYLYTYLAAARIGAVMVGFSILYTPPELVRLAHSDGPQHVTLHGRDAVVIIDSDEFHRLKGERTGQHLIDALQTSPYREIDIEPRRSAMPVRAVKP